MSNEFFKDLSLNFTPNPVTGDISIVKNEAAVKKALTNLLRTPKGSKPFNPDYGSTVFNYLFAQADEQSQLDLNEELADTIRRFEPRVNLIAIESTIDDYGIEVTVEYYVLNSSQLQSLTTNITRTS